MAHGLSLNKNILKFIETGVVSFADKNKISKQHLMCGDGLHQQQQQQDQQQYQHR